MSINNKEIPEIKSLRWLANMFPYVENPEDESDKMSNAIHTYATAGADKLEELKNLVDYFIDNKRDTSSRLKEHDIVIHFKHERDSKQNEMKYLYEILSFAKHTENEESLVIYKNIITGKVFARPYEMFMGEVDHEKYPDIKQKYRLEKYV